MTPSPPTFIGFDPADPKSDHSTFVVIDGDGAAHPLRDERALRVLMERTEPLADAMRAFDIDPDMLARLVEEYGAIKQNRAQRRRNVHGHLGRKPGPKVRR